MHCMCITEISSILDNYSVKYMVELLRNHMPAKHDQPVLTKLTLTLNITPNNLNMNKINEIVSEVES